MSLFTVLETVTVEVPMYLCRRPEAEVLLNSREQMLREKQEVSV